MIVLEVYENITALEIVDNRPVLEIDTNINLYPYLVQSVNGQTGIVVLTKSDIGLGNVDNTSDLNKPISTATQTALDLKASIVYVDAGLAAKASIAYVDTGLATKLSNITGLIVNGTNTTVSGAGTIASPYTINTTGSPPGGLNTYVQFNDGGSTFGGDAEFTYDKTTNVLSVPQVSLTKVQNSLSALGYIDFNHLGDYNQTYISANRTLTLFNNANFYGIEILPNSGVLIQNQDNTNTTLIVRGPAGLSANFQEWQNNSNTALAYVDRSGNIIGQRIYSYDTFQGSYYTNITNTNAYITAALNSTHDFAVISRTPSHIPFSIQAAGSQTADLFRWLDSGNVTLSFINSLGNGLFNKFGVNVTSVSPAVGLTVGADTSTQAIVITNVDSIGLATHWGVTTGSNYIGYGNSESWNMYKDGNGWIFNSDKSGTGTIRAMRWMMGNSASVFGVLPNGRFFVGNNLSPTALLYVENPNDNQLIFKVKGLNAGTQNLAEFTGRFGQTLIVNNDSGIQTAAGVANGFGGIPVGGTILSIYGSAGGTAIELRSGSFFNNNTGSYPDWSSQGVLWRSADGTVTNTSSSGSISGIRPLYTFASIALAANSSTIFANVTTVYIKAAPGAGTNVTNTNAWGLYVDNSAKVYFDGLVGYGIVPTALIHLKAGTTTVAPLALTAGTNRTTPQDGAFEFDGTLLYFTVGGTRKTVTLV